MMKRFGININAGKTTRRNGWEYAYNILVDLIHESQGGKCYLCQRGFDPKKLQIEHKIPLSRGGQNKMSNVALACRRCNTAKGALTYEEYQQTEYYKIMVMGGCEKADAWMRVHKKEYHRLAVLKLRRRNKDEINARRRHRYATEPEHREKIQARNIKNRLKHVDKRRAADRLWWSKHGKERNARNRERYSTDPEYRERICRYAREYRQRHGDKINAKERHRRATDPVYGDKRRARDKARRRVKSTNSPELRV